MVPGFSSSAILSGREELVRGGGGNPPPLSAAWEVGSGHTFRLKVVTMYDFASSYAAILDPLLDTCGKESAQTRLPSIKTFL